jgi:predicted glycoside hydrolase/deacetylase ChbG (UPF0249 family)
VLKEKSINTTKYRYLIINADDFGMSYEVNEGIKLAINEGILTSVSVMANMPYFDDAIKFLKKKPHIAVGLHFNLSEGSPLLPVKQVKTLVREDNNFFTWLITAFYIIKKRTSSKEIEAELQAQFEKLEKTGLKISHIDSHHHIHLLPQLFRILIKFAAKKKINTLRCKHFDFFHFFNRIKHKHTLKQFLIISLCLINNFIFNKSSYLFETDNIYDLNWVDKLSEKEFISLLQRLPQGTTEIICHPAIESKTGNLLFLTTRYRTLKLLIAKSLPNILNENNIKLSYRI